VLLFGIREVISPNRKLISSKSKVGPKRDTERMEGAARDQRFKLQIFSTTVTVEILGP